MIRDPKLLFVTSTRFPRREETVRNLRNAIIRGRLKPREHLIERELCELTGVSRTSVREALRQLEAEGLVESIPNKGPCVAAVTPETARDVFEIRASLESLLYRLFAERASSDQIKTFRREVKRVQKAYLRENAQEMDEACEGYYQVLFEGCGNKSIGPILRSLHARMAVLRRPALVKPGYSSQGIEEMRRLLEAVERRDAQAAWEAGLQHVKGVESAAVEILSVLEEKRLTLGEEAWPLWDDVLEGSSKTKGSSHDR